MDTLEARRLLSCLYHANAVLLAIIGVFPALWALMPAAMMIDAPDITFVAFTGAMMLIPLAVTLLCELTAAALVATGIAVRSGSTASALLSVAMLALLVPPLGPFLAIGTAAVVYADRAR